MIEEAYELYKSMENLGEMCAELGMLKMRLCGMGTVPRDVMVTVDLLLKKVDAMNILYKKCKKEE